MPGSQQSFFIYYWAPVAAYIPFVFAFGAIVGSFLNVVILRMPEGLNIVTPPSRCPKCNHRLKWHENLPILGWIRLGGKCASCKLPISPQYPMIEALVAIVFTLVYVLYFMVNPRHPHWITDFIPEWSTRLGLENSWPLLILHFVLLAALLAMTVIDARTYTIPIQITWTVTIFAFLVHAIMPVWPAARTPFPLVRSPECVNLAEWTIPLTGPVSFCASVGAMTGLGVSIILMRLNQLRLSFMDFDLWVKEDDQIIDYPHPRRELSWEFDYLAPIVLCLVIGTWIGLRLNASGTTLPLSLGALGGSMLGYLVGAGLVWGIRIFGTLAFGKEAMGLGDAHLLGCVGAVLGWVDPIVIFFMAPFLTIFGMIILAVLSRFLGGLKRYIPFGPWLALATVVTMFCGHWIAQFLSALTGICFVLP